MNSADQVALDYAAELRRDPGVRNVKVHPGRRWAVSRVTWETKGNVGSFRPYRCRKCGESAACDRGVCAECRVGEVVS